MDDLDATILQELAWTPDDPRHAVRGVRQVWDIARERGIHGSTLKRRLASMRESGLLRGIRLQPEPSLMGCRGSEHVLSFPDAAATARGLAKLVAHPHVWMARSFLENEIIVETAAPLDVDERDLVASLARASAATRARFRRHTGWGLPVDRISALDLRVLAAFTYEAHRPVAEGARDVGISAKSTRNRLAALAKAHAFKILPDIDHAHPDAGLTVFLDVSLAPGAGAPAQREIASLFPDALGRSRADQENAHVLVRARSATEIADLLMRAETIPGVTRVRHHVVHQTLHAPERWRDALLARAEELARANGIWAAPWRTSPLVARTVRSPAST